MRRGRHNRLGSSRSAVIVYFRTDLVGTLGRAPASASTTVAAACFRARLARAPSPAGERTARVLAGYRRTAGDRGRGQTRPFVAADLAAVLATCNRPRRRGRGVESDPVARERGRLDAVIAGLLFMAGMRRSEVSALHWADVADAADGDGVLVTVRRSKTNQEGETTDVRFVKGGVARAIRTLRAAATPGPADRVAPLSPKMVGLRFQAAARAAGVEHVTAPLRPRRAGVGTHEPGGVDHRRDAGRELEDEPDGGALQRRGDGRARGRGAVPLKQAPAVALSGSLLLEHFLSCRAESAWYRARRPVSRPSAPRSGGEATCLDADEAHGSR